MMVVVPGPPIFRMRAMPSPATAASSQRHRGCGRSPPPHPALATSRHSGAEVCPLPTRIVLSYLTLWVHPVEITTKPAWSEPAHVASAGYGQRAVPPAHI